MTRDEDKRTNAHTSSNIRLGQRKCGIKHCSEEAEGGDVVVYGGVQLVQTLVEKGLVDEMILLQSPVALGEGKRLFIKRSDWEVVEARRFECGLVMLRYRTKS